MQSAIRGSQKVRLCSSDRKQNLHAPPTASPSGPNFARERVPSRERSSARSSSLDSLELMSAFSARGALTPDARYSRDSEGPSPSISAAPFSSILRQTPARGCIPPSALSSPPPSLSWEDLIIHGDQSSPLLPARRHARRVGIIIIIIMRPRLTRLARCE